MSFTSRLRVEQLNTQPVQHAAGDDAERGLHLVPSARIEMEGEDATPEALSSTDTDPEAVRTQYIEQQRAALAKVQERAARRDQMHAEKKQSLDTIVVGLPEKAAAVERAKAAADSLTAEAQTILAELRTAYEQRIVALEALTAEVYVRDENGAVPAVEAVLQVGNTTDLVDRYRAFMDVALTELEAAVRPDESVVTTPEFAAAA